MASIVRAAQAVGRSYTAVGYDVKKDSVYMDICSPRGMVTATALMRRLKIAGLGWLATVCSSFVWISRASTKRTVASPRGSPSSASAIMGNRMCARSALLFLFCTAKQGWAVIEQPISSVLASHPAARFLQDLADAFSWCGWHVANSYMGAFGGATPKMHRFFSNHRLVHALSRDRPSLSSFGSASRDVTRVDEVVNSEGRIVKRKITGAPGLKGTENYSDEFGEAVVQTWESFAGLTQDPVDLDVEPVPFSPSAWEDLCMDDVLQMLQQDAGAE